MLVPSMSDESIRITMELVTEVGCAIDDLINDMLIDDDNYHFEDEKNE